MNSRKTYFRNSVAVCALMDAVSSLCGLIAALWVVSGRDMASAGKPEFVFMLLVYTALLLMYFAGFEMYSAVLFRLKVMLVTILLSNLYAFASTLAIYPLIFKSYPKIGFLAPGTALSVLALLIWREIRYVYCLLRKNKLRLLIIEKLKDDNSRVRRLKYACMDRFHAWYEQVDTSNPEAILRFIDAEFPRYDGICLMESIPMAARDMFVRAIVRLGKELYVIPATYELNFSKVRMALFDDVMAFGIYPYRMTLTQLFIKRFFDIAVSAIGIALTGLPMLVIALWIKLTSPGPVFFRQVRLTRNRREFNIIKFRSMVPDAEAAVGPVFAEKDDPRITRIGRVLRASRLDELPQLFNVLAGAMSIVGPRPERPYFAGQFEMQFENYNQRFMVKAGLTSLSHVYGRYSTDIEDRTRYDLMYIRNYSFWMDLKVLLLTTRVVLLKEAAEGVCGAGFQKVSPWQGMQRPSDANVS